MGMVGIKYPTDPKEDARRAKFLECFAKNDCNFEATIKDMHVSTVTLMAWRNRLPEFNEAFEQVKFEREYKIAQDRGSMVCYASNHGRNIMNVEAVKEAFLLELAKHGSVKKAAQTIHPIDERWLYQFTRCLYVWKQNDPVFAEGWRAAIEQSCDMLEEEAIRRGVEGWDEEVYQKGQLVGTVRKYDPNLLMRLMAGRRPERYSNKPGEQKSIHLHVGSNAQEAFTAIAASMNELSMNKAIDVVTEDSKHLISNSEREDDEESDNG